MNKKDLQNAIREFLSKDGNSPITEANLTKAQLDKREDYLKNLKKNKKELVKRYGKDAESVMYGRATNLAKKAVSEMDKQKLKELVRNSLMNENREFTEEEIQDAMDAFHMSREDAITHLQQTYEDYKQFDMKEGKKEDMDGDGDIDSKDYLLKRDAAIQKAKGEIKEASMFATGGNINPELVKKVEQFVKGVAKYYDYSVDDAFSSIMTILKGGIAKEGVNEDIDLGHQDNEPHMIKGDLYQIGKYAMELYAVLEEIEETNQEVDFPAWWQSKITVAKENMDGAKHYLEFELKEPAIDAAVDAATGEAPHIGEPEAPMMNEDEISKADILSGELYKLKGKIQDAYFAKIRKFINMGSYEDAEYLLNRVKGQMKEKSLAEIIAKQLKSK
jgi:hypothetical protein